jgi:hypothetical protein
MDLVGATSSAITTQCANPSIESSLGITNDTSVPQYMRGACNGVWFSFLHPSHRIMLQMVLRHEVVLDGVNSMSAGPFLGLVWRVISTTNHIQSCVKREDYRWIGGCDANSRIIRRCSLRNWEAPSHVHRQRPACRQDSRASRSRVCSYTPRLGHGCSHTQYSCSPRRRTWPTIACNSRKEALSRGFRVPRFAI